MRPYLPLFLALLAGCVSTPPGPPLGTPWTAPTASEDPAPSPWAGFSIKPFFGFWRPRDADIEEAYGTFKIVGMEAWSPIWRGGEAPYQGGTAWTPTIGFRTGCGYFWGDAEGSIGGGAGPTLNYKVTALGLGAWALVSLETGPSQPVNFYIGAGPAFCFLKETARVSGYNAEAVEKETAWGWRAVAGLEFRPIPECFFSIEGSTSWIDIEDRNAGGPGLSVGFGVTF